MPGLTWIPSLRLHFMLHPIVGNGDVVKVLLDAGPDPNKANSLGVLALFWPAWFNEVRTVELLLAAGSDPNEPTMVGGYKDSTRWGMKELSQVHTDTGETPLHVTAYCSTGGAAQALLDGGADLTARRHGGDRGPAEGGDLGPAAGGRSRGPGGSCDVPSPRAADSFGHAPAAAGGCHHRGPEPDRRGCREQGADGARGPVRPERRRALDEGGNAAMVSKLLVVFVRGQGRSAGAEHRQSVLASYKEWRNGNARSSLRPHR